MEPRELLELLLVASKLKDTTRHCYTAKGKQESVAEHSWMMTLMAYFMENEFPNADMNKVIKMCIIHDLGEVFIDDIPTFDKNEDDEKNESNLLMKWIATFPKKYESEMTSLFIEMKEQKTLEAKIYKAIDSLEALIQHDISDLNTWTLYEREFNVTYADDRVQFSKYLKALREEIRSDTIKKIKGE